MRNWEIPCPRLLRRSAGPVGGSPTGNDDGDPFMRRSRFLLTILGLAAVLLPLSSFSQSVADPQRRPRTAAAVGGSAGRAGARTPGPAWFDIRDYGARHHDMTGASFCAAVEAA